MQMNWNQSDNWEVQRIYTEQARLVAVLPPEGDRVRHVVALRRCVPQLRQERPAALLAQVAKCSEVDLGEMAGRWARQLAQRLEAEGLGVRVINTSYISYVPFNYTTNTVWLIEDDEAAERIAAEMIAHGVPVVDVEA